MDSCVSNTCRMSSVVAGDHHWRLHRRGLPSQASCSRYITNPGRAWTHDGSDPAPSPATPATPRACAAEAPNHWPRGARVDLLTQRRRALGAGSGQTMQASEKPPSDGTLSRGATASTTAIALPTHAQSTHTARGLFCWLHFVQHGGVGSNPRAGVDLPRTARPTCRAGALASTVPTPPSPAKDLQHCHRSTMQPDKGSESGCRLASTAAAGAGDGALRSFRSAWRVSPLVSTTRSPSSNDTARREYSLTVCGNSGLRLGQSAWERLAGRSQASACVACRSPRHVHRVNCDKTGALPRCARVDTTLIPILKARSREWHQGDKQGDVRHAVGGWHARRTSVHAPCSCEPRTRPFRAVCQKIAALSIVCNGLVGTTRTRSRVGRCETTLAQHTRARAPPPREF